MQATLERLKARREGRGDEGGFTLIELLIVIVILAILAAIVVFAVQNLTGTSAKSACESDVQTVDHAIQAYVAQVGTQPAAGEITTGTGLMTTTTGSNGDTVGPWLHSVPVNGTHYQISVQTGADGNSYAAVMSPAAAYAAATGILYEPNGTAAALVATSTSAACANVKA
jgi:prepilin-type N-terminal cleavage/methylation domain-containing protein